MSKFTVDLPYKYYPDPTKGKPVYLGYIYIGEPNTDPEIVGNQKAVTIDGVTPISQPIRTSAGGVPDYNGSPATLFVDGPYSIKVLNSKGDQVYYAATVLDDIQTQIEANTTLIEGNVKNFATLAAAVAETDTSRIFVGAAANLKERTTGNGGGAMWDVIATGATKYIDLPNGYNVVELAGVAGLSIAMRVSSTVSLIDLGGVPDYNGTTGTDNTDAIEFALTYCVENGIVLDMSTLSKGGFYQVGDIDLTSVVPAAFADTLSIKSDSDIETDLTWIFKDSDGVGVELPSALQLRMEYITIATDAVTPLTSGFSRIGISSTTADRSFIFNHKGVNVKGFTGAGFRFHDVITSSCKGGRCTSNVIAYDFGLTFWAGLASTTINWSGGYFIGNDVGINGVRVSESLFQGVVFENNRIGFENLSGIKNTFIGCYGENNTEYSYYDGSTKGAAFVNCFAKTAGDGWVAVGTTGAFGFNTIGSGIYDSDGVNTQALTFYNRDGGMGEGISAQNSDGTLQLLDNTASVVGAIGISYAESNSGKPQRGLYSFLISDGTLVGRKPDTWTITRNGTGDYKIAFDVAVRPPLLSITVAPMIHNAVAGGQIDVDLYTRVYGSGDWESFSTSTGIQILTKVAGVATDAKVWVRCDEI